jgi:hypothetical protein
MARMPKARTFTTSWCSINSERTGPPSRCSGTGGHMRTPFPELPKSRRKTSRVEAPEVRVYWSSGGRNDLLRVRNLSLGGMFVETRNPESVGSTEQINFLVEEGQIRTKAVVRHIKNASGMGLQTPPSGGSTDQTSCVGAVPSQPTSLTGSP